MSEELHEFPLPSPRLVLSGGQPPEVLSRAWYSASIDGFCESNSECVIGTLTSRSDFSVGLPQRDAWLSQVTLLQDQLSSLEGTLFLEFNIPRMGRRIDAVVVLGPAVFAIEFKVGDRSFERSALDQAWDYALDLKNFHEASHELPIVPILIATEATSAPTAQLIKDPDGLLRPIAVPADGLREVIDQVLALVSGETVDAQQWAVAPYRPTPTIIEAARSLYAHHSVEAIARYDAGAMNLRMTSQRIEQIVDESRLCARKSICFVTGVPGAGKTLVGLNLATRRQENDPTHAVFLSGNGPLVAVLREALTRDEVARKKGSGQVVRTGRVRESVKAFIQNVHHFRDDALIDRGPPSERVVIFDEAQRAWNLRQTASFMKRKKKQPGFSQSEPEFLMSCMDRHPDWAVVVCLVGGGQEIKINWLR